MRKLILTSFTLLAVITSCFAQQELIIEQLTELWIGNNWKNYIKMTYQYNQNLNTDTSKTHQWDSVNGSWNTVGRKGYTYNGDMQLTERISETNYTGSWTNSSKFMYTYNGNGLLTGYTSFGWVANAWLNSYQYQYTYDNNGNRIEALEQYWDSNSSSWKPSSKINSTFTNNVETEAIKQIYNENNSTWENNSRTISTLDSNDVYTEKVQQGWQSGMWNNFSKQTYSYNGDGNGDSTVTFNWNQNNSAWDLTELKTFFYNLNMALHQEVSQLYQGGGSNPWQPNSRTTYTYDSFQGLDGIEVVALNVYPNPTSDLINIQLESAEKAIAVIYNSNGEVVGTQRLAGKVNSIPLSHLPAGNYFIQLQQDAKMYVGSFVKM